MNTPPEDPKTTDGLSTRSGFHPTGRFARRLFSGRILRRALFALACLFTLVALFYTEENWRGKQAWHQRRRELQAKGVNLNWENFIPPPVPDEQNIFKAPKMQEWFVRAAGRAVTSNELSARIKAVHGLEDTNVVLLAELTVRRPEAVVEPQEPGAVWQFGAPTARAQAQEFLRNALGSFLPGSWGPLLVARPTQQIKAEHIILETDAPLGAEKIRQLFPENSAIPGRAALVVSAEGSNSFKILLTPAGIAASDYLAGTDGLAPEFDIIRKGLERPYARMEGNYEEPYKVPFPNFIVIRTVAQMFAQRAQCHLLLGEPARALHELTAVHNLCRLMEAKPSGKPMLLVSAMIDVAVTGLYAGIIADGLRLHAWQEPELIALQKQLEEINLLLPVANSIQTEWALECRWLETRLGYLVKLLAFGDREPTSWQKITTPKYWLLNSMPRGWVYRNMVTVTTVSESFIESVDPTKGVVLPRNADAFARKIETVAGYSSPYTVLAAVAVPNYTKAAQTLARNQTMVNEAMIACALERYRIVHKEYPESLTSLVPQFIGQLPRDLVNGQPLKYRRTNPGQFLLYSVGWNEIDDGGGPGKTNADGDWVWDSQRP